MSEKSIVAKAIDRLKEIGYHVVIATCNGATRCVIGEGVPTLYAIERAEGSDQAVFHLERPGHHCSLLVVWGLGEDCIADVSADSVDELERVDELVYG